MDGKKPLNFKDFIAVDYTGGEDDQIAKNAKDRKQDEALNFSQRRARARQMKKIKAKIAMGRRRAAKKFADPARLKKRARKQAISQLFKKFSKGKSRGEVPFARRQEIEKRIEKMSGRVDKIARKILPQVRKLEKERKGAKAGSK